MTQEVSWKESKALILKLLHINNKIMEYYHDINSKS